MKKVLALGICCLILATPVAAKKEPQLTGLALQQIQSRDLETTTDIAFPAVMTVLQDSGYRILAADKETGLISAQGSTESKLSYNIWWGMGKKKEVPIVSAFIEMRGPGITRVRLNFVMSTGKTRNTFTDEKPITDPAVYKDAFERIEKEVFTRSAMMASPASTAATDKGAVSTAK